MQTCQRLVSFGFLVAIVLWNASAQAITPADPLPSWRDGATKTSIMEFVARVTDSDSPDFVPVAERIATFDNDGTLWSEKPYYFQLAFALDRVRELAKDHPEWKTEQPYKAALEGDIDTIAKSGKEGLLKLVMASHSGMTSEEFARTAKNWMAATQHPRFKRAYDKLVFQPMLELLAYLRANDFQTFIASGGGIDFLRVFAEDAYGIAPEQIIGSRIKTKLAVRKDQPVIERLPEIDFINDGAGKPVGIHNHIGRRPIAAFGNSDGDLEMLQWTAAGKGRRLCVLIHHTDEQREWAYDRDTHVGRLDKALVEADSRGWTVVDMRRDWKVVYPQDE